MNPALPKTTRKGWVNPALPKENELNTTRKGWVNPALPKNWHYVYLLKNNTTSWVYIGCTNDLEKRLKEHMEGQVYSTKKMLPVELIYYEAYPSKDCAYQREKNLKTYGSGLANLKSRLGLIKKGRAG